MRCKQCGKCCTYGFIVSFEGPVQFPKKFTEIVLNKHDEVI